MTSLLYFLSLSARWECRLEIANDRFWHGYGSWTDVFRLLVDWSNYSWQIMLKLLGSLIKSNLINQKRNRKKLFSLLCVVCWWWWEFYRKLETNIVLKINNVLYGSSLLILFQDIRAGPRAGWKICPVLSSTTYTIISSSFIVLLFFSPWLIRHTDEIWSFSFRTFFFLQHPTVRAIGRMKFHC